MNKIKKIIRRIIKGDFSFSINEFIKDPRYRFIFILGLFLLSFFLFLSFTSYLFTWKIDQSELSKLKPEIPVQNSLGSFGAVIAHFFFYRGFGIASFTLPIMLLTYALRLLIPKNNIPDKEIYKYSITSLFWFSPLLAFIFHSTNFPWGGAFGGFLVDIGTIYIGKLGTITAIIFGGVVLSVINFELDVLEYIQKLTTKKKVIEQGGFDVVSTTNPIVKDTSTTVKKEPVSNTPEKVLDITSTIAGQTTEIKKSVTSQKEDNGFETVEKPTTNIKTDSSVDEELVILETKEEEIAEKKKAVSNNYDPTLDLASYKYPKLDLLVDHGSDKVLVDKQELEDNKNQIVQTLDNYKIKIDKIKATIGPTVTLYEIIPEPGTRISKIKNLEDDIALSLAALGIRIIAPIPGKGTIGIEVPNSSPEIVAMRSVLGSEKFVNAKMDLPLALGKSISNEIVVADLTKMPHLLIAGATGQGKSVGINSILVSLLYKKHPSQLKFVLVDPKKVELSIYKTIENHFLAKLPNEEDPIITDTQKVVNTLNSLCIEMDTRYDLLKIAMCRNIKEYNEKFTNRKLNPEKGHRFLPYIVLVIDEFADLIMTAGKEVEIPIARLAQLARAIGIHLIIATQRPSVNIITGMIKANFPARIAFKVMAKVDSRTILDTSGADQLIGRGDMLYSPGSEVIRLQCPFVDTPEVDEICNFIGEQRGYGMAWELPEYVGEEAASSANFDSNNKDALFEEAAHIVVGMQSGSTSMLQRRLKLGYNRAGRLMDELEAAGIVGGANGSKPREVFILTEMDLIQHLENI